MGRGTLAVRGLQERARREGVRVVLGPGLRKFGARRLYLLLGFRVT